MAWFNLFSGPTAEKRLNKKGMRWVQPGFWGAAKLEYERALRKGEAATGQDRDWLGRIERKIADAKEALARNISAMRCNWRKLVISKRPWNWWHWPWN
jgi:hypothetical protein